MAEDLNVGMKCVKYLMFVANFMFAITGLLLISIGCLVKFYYNEFEFFLKDSYFTPATFVIAIGVITFFVAFFGCVGALKESTMLINLYAAFLACILILEISAVIAALSIRPNVRSYVHGSMSNSFIDYYNNPDISLIWNHTQETLGCCGVDGPGDYPPAGVPPSCHINEFGDPDDNFQFGCSIVLSSLVIDSALLLSVGALCVAFIQMIGIIFARLLAKTVRNLKTQALIDREKQRQQFYSQVVLSNESEKKGENDVYYAATTDA